MLGAKLVGKGWEGGDMEDNMVDPGETGLPKSLLAGKKKWDQVMTDETFWSFESCASRGAPALL